MKFTDLFVKRPVLAIVVNLVILIAGLQAIRSLSVRQYPRSDIAVVQVTTVYVGASADLVRGFVTTPIERVIASADGIDYMESTSAQGLSTIQVHLKINYDTTAALTQIQAKVAQVRNDLPPEAQIPVIDLETADTQFAAMYIGISSPDLDQNQITDYLTRVVQPKLSSISGVQRADILGDRTFAMRLWLKPQEMAARGVSPSDVHDALAKNNYLSALGATKGSMVSVNLIANTDLRTPEEFRQMVVKQQNGVVVRLGEIADVQLGAENYDQDVRFNGETATFMGIWVLPTANSLEVIRNVRKELPAIQQQLPTGMKLGVPYDSTEYIQDAINEVLHTLVETLLIVVVVIFLFLGSFRSVLIPVVAIPISLIGAVFLMLLAGFTINLLTLLAIVLSVGLVVDDAIVMVENVERHLHMGKTPFQAARDAARELVGPIIAMTITLAAVYAPIGIQGGLTGALFREFAFTLAGAVIVSGVVALTLVADDGFEIAAGRRHGSWLCRHCQSGLRTHPKSVCAVADRNIKLSPCSAHGLGSCRCADDSFVHVLSARAGAVRRPGSCIRSYSILREFDSRPNQLVYAASLRCLPLISREREHIPDHESGRWIRRYGDEGMEPAKKDRTRTPGGVVGSAVKDCRRPCDSPDSAAPSRRRQLPG